MNPISVKGHPPPTQSEKRRKVMGECADKNCSEATTQQAKEHPNSQPTAKKPLSRLRLNHHHSKMNSTTQVNKQQTHQRGVEVESNVNLRRRFACCKLAAAKSICRHRSCKALSSLPQPSSSARSSRKSSKALANLHNVTTNFVLGVGSQAGPQEEATDDASNNFEILMLSLQSPLPNEHSLTLNTLMILSSVVKDKELNILEKTPALLNMILGHVGFYSDCALRLLMEQTCGDLRDFKAFWQDARSELKDVFQLQRQLLCECFPQDNRDYLGKCCDGCGFSQVQVPLNKPPRTALPVSKEKVGGQVQQIGHILRNFSFETGNASRMAMNATMLRFLLVAGTSNHGTLPQISFDIISNITKYIVLMPLASNDKGAIFQLQAIMMDLVISTFLDSGDRFKILRCLEALQGVALAGGDREAKMRIFRDMRVFEKLFQFLTLKEDTILVINCLECLLAATAEGMGKTCDKIIESVHGCVATLVSYLTVDVMENFVNTENGFRNENFRTELVGIEKALDNKSVERNTFSEVAISEEKKINGCVSRNQSCAKAKSSRLVSTSTPKQTPQSSSQSQEKYHIAPSSSFRKKLGPYDEAVTILENVKKIPEGKSITLMLSPEALSLLERKHELQIKRLVFPTDHSPDSIHTDKIYVELVRYQSNNFVRKAPTGMICGPSLSSSLPFSAAPSLNNILETAIPFLCEWDSCGSRHISKIQLRWHVYLWHMPNNAADKIVCKWRSRSSLVEGCSCPRDKDCLLEHLMDHHYNDKALEQALYQRINKNNISPPPPPREKPRISCGNHDYHNLSNGESGMSAQGSGSWQQPQIEEKEEHVVNKSVRLTAALILRNFAKNSGRARRSLKKYEVQLAELAMSGYDCSGIISHILHYLNEGF